MKLHTLLSGKHPAAALALQSLIAGRIIVTEIRQPGKDRHYLQGRFRIKLIA